MFSYLGAWSNPPPETRFLRADLIEVFKILRGFENLDLDSFFHVIGNGARRGHSFKRFKKRYRLDIGKFKFASRVCEAGNRLGDGIVSAGTVNVFKMKLDHYLRYMGGIYKHLFFSPADGPSMTVYSWLDPGNPGTPLPTGTFSSGLYLLQDTSIFTRYKYFFFTKTHPPEVMMAAFWFA